MNAKLNLSPIHRTFTYRFITACQADERVVAAFLGGSYARGTADAHSDIDLYLITTDNTFQDFYAGRETFLRQLGELVFLENFDLQDIAFYMISDGTEGELRFGRESYFTHIHSGPYQILLDKKNLLAGVVFPERKPDPVEQVEILRRQIYWFWHDLSHFITAMGRGQLWWAYGQLEVIRQNVVNLARMQYNFADPDIGEECYFKIENAIPIEPLAVLQATFCPFEKEAILQAAWITLHFYQELAPDLANQYGIAYPVKLEHLMIERLENLRAIGNS